MAIESLPAAAAPRQALERAHLDVTVRGLDAVVAVSYSFRNAEPKAIEALFTFPMPRSAAFLGLSAEIGGETIEAEVIEARDALRRYDDAISDGDSALLLRQLAPGLLQASLGNVGPGEEARFTLRYALPLTVLERRLRLRLPMNLRPRYGAWDLDELDEPVHDAGVEYALSARLRVEGFLAGASLACVSHPARFERRGEVAELALIDAWLDGDVVVEFGLDAALPPVGECFPDGDAAGARVQVLLPPAPDEAQKPLQTILLLDCSGSMAGDAILGCRAALEAVAQALDENDRLQVMRFGSDVHALLRRPIRVGEAVRRSLSELAATVQADLGGTEMGKALGRALDDLALTRDPACAQAIFLVTDGAIQPHDIEHALQRAIDEGVRVFVVAVGSSASLETLEPLATRTRGQLEQVMPGEAIAGAVLSQLRRMRQSSPLTVHFQFETEAGPVEASALAYGGDAVGLQLALPAPATQVRASCALWNEPLRFALTPVEASPDRLALLGLARYRATNDEGQQRELALRYRLLTPFTSAILVRRRADGERFEELPAIRPQPQMLSRGMAAAAASGRVLMPDAAASALCTDATSFSAVHFSALDLLGEAHVDESAPLPDEPALPPAPGPESIRQALLALQAAVLAALEKTQPDLSRTTLLAQLPDTLHEVFEWLLREGLWVESDADWLALLDALTGLDLGVPVDTGMQDAIATALLLAGYGGRADHELAELRERLQSLIET
ncbi:VIT and vWA domain-containing protein [Rehaibacterium terrae]|jgi:Ca-activated chloride channel family protein|uniref:Ca-activated chloride channel family protein n=1 Tax=Rehaibacterium terrae TaxID=1341696 RepID=A0A7W7XZS6_9GAMM|nr:VIT and VWA domain-containing protein [Rehaibacterium terrae]MBB5015430.1 Ca-activated chloride channel family protein [Rehaibacterium terrae]